MNLWRLLLLVGASGAAASLQLPLVLAAVAVLVHRIADWLPASIGPAATQLISAAQASAVQGQAVSSSPVVADAHGWCYSVWPQDLTTRVRRCSL
jgi:hypothetical protein